MAKRRSTLLLSSTFMTLSDVRYIPMMKPEDRVECCIVNIAHMTIIATDFAVNAVVDVLNAAIGAGRIRCPLMIAESSKILVIGIIQDEVDVGLVAFELIGYGIEDLIFLGLCIAGARSRIAKSAWPFIVLFQCQSLLICQKSRLTGATGKSPFTGLRGLNV